MVQSEYIYIYIWLTQDASCDQYDICKKNMKDIYHTVYEKKKRKSCKQTNSSNLFISFSSKHSP